MAQEKIWANIERLMNRKNLYALVVGSSLAYFLFNHSQIGMSETRIFKYSILFVLSLFPIYVSKENIVTGTKGIINFEGKGKSGPLSMAASWAIGLVVGFTGMLVIAIIQARNITGLPVEGIMPMMAQQALIVAPVETIVFVVIAPQYVSHALGEGKWGTILTFISTQGAFALFHFEAYAGDPVNLSIAFFMGIVFLGVAVTLRPEMAQGLHTGVNYVQSGIVPVGASALAIAAMMGLG